MCYVNEDSIWWHNDGGNPPELVLTDINGALKSRCPMPQGIRNIDWEDMTVDDGGHLYIGDFGNNNRPRSNFTIYRIKPGEEKYQALNYQYPEQKAPNVEAMFWSEGYLYLFSKDHLPNGRYLTKQYRLKDDVSEQIAYFQDSISLKKRVVTGAAIQPKDGVIALVGYRFHRILGLFPSSAASLFIIRDYPGDLFLRGHIQSIAVAPFLAKQYESLDFTLENQIIIASEKTWIFRQKARKIRY